MIINHSKKFYTRCNWLAPDYHNAATISGVQDTDDLSFYCNTDTDELQQSYKCEKENLPAVTEARGELLVKKETGRQGDRETRRSRLMAKS